MDYLNQIKMSSKDNLIECLLDTLFGMTIADIILDYYH